MRFLLTLVEGNQIGAAFWFVYALLHVPGISANDNTGKPFLVNTASMALECTFEYHLVIIHSLTAS
jgi:hypothetical protein